jgi:hypothetical protein
MLTRSALFALIVAVPTQTYAETPRETFEHEYNVCMDMNNGQSSCERAARAAAYVTECVNEGNGRWLNWGIHGDCVEKAQKLFPDVYP